MRQRHYWRSHASASGRGIHTNGWAEPNPNTHILCTLALVFLRMISVYHGVTQLAGFGIPGSHVKLVSRHPRLELERESPGHYCCRLSVPLKFVTIVHANKTGPGETDNPKDGNPDPYLRQKLPGFRYIHHCPMLVATSKRCECTGKMARTM